MLEDIQFRKPNQTRVANAWGDPGPDVYVALGAYQHGGFVGLTKATENFEYLTKYLVSFLKHHAGVGDPFTSVVVARNLGTKLHKDKYNISGRRNITISFGSFSGGGVWIEGEHGEYPRHEQQLPNGDVVCGTVLPGKDAILRFDPRRWHSSMPWTGTKWSVIGYCNRGINRMEPRDVQRLKAYDFPLPELPAATLGSMRLADDIVEYDYCETEDEEEYYDIGTIGEERLMRMRRLLDEEERIESYGLAPGNQEEREAVSLVNVRTMKICEQLEAKDLEHDDGASPTDAVEWFRLCRLVEGGEQHGVEDLLRQLEEPLQVVYTMTLGEVRENIDAWKKAILKEAQALLDCGALVKMHPTEEKRLTQEGKLVVLPAKGVFTVKPPDQATADGVRTKPQDQTESFDGVRTKPQDQTESFDGVRTKPQDQTESFDVLTKPQDQTESFDGVRTKPQDQTESFDGVRTKPQDQTESFDGASTGKGSQKGRRKIKVMLVDSLFKRKARLVICGNFEKHITEELYAGGCQTESLRVMISHAASRRTWDAAVTDIRNAFLLAPMSTDAVYGLRFPKVFILALGLEWEGLYRVDRALYGFRRSPRLWGSYRDGRLRTARIKIGSRVAILKRLTADENIWQVLVLKPISDDPDYVAAYVVVYVDDIMYLGPPEVIESIHQWLSSEWTASPLTWASSSEGIRFLGLEIYKGPSCYRMCQWGYLKELLRHHGLAEGPAARTPCPREWLIGEGEFDQTVYDESSLRAAQRITGELLWLSTKSRPDLMHTVATMSSLCLRDPILVERIGKRALAYLYGTSQFMLMFRGEGEGPHDVKAFSDASFSPSGGRSIGCSLITYNYNPVAWRAGKQTLTSLSTAEAELIEAVAAIQLLAGVGSLTEEINDKAINRTLLVDNTAAVGLCTDSPGTWRTRHLRVRAGALREAVREGQLVVSHIAGAYQKADLGTKAFDAVRLFDLMQQWGLVKYDVEPAAPADSSEAAASSTTTSSTTRTRLEVVWVRALTRVVLALACLSQPAAAKTVRPPREKPDLEVTFPWELYGMVFLLVVAGIAMWECVKKIWSRFYPEEVESKEARRLRKLQSAVREELHGIGLSASSSSTRTTPRTYTATSGEYPPPPPYPCGDDDLPPLEELRSTRRRTRTMNQGVQTEHRGAHGEVTISYGQTLFTTKSGKCVHSRSNCSSLTIGGRLEEKHLCQLCNRG